MEQKRLRDYVIERDDEGHMTWYRHRPEMGLICGTASVDGDVLFLSDWRSRGKYKGELDHIDQLPAWDETAYYARTTRKGWSGVRRCDTGALNEEESRAILKSLRKVCDNVVRSLAVGDVVEIRSSIEVQEVEQAIHVLEQHHQGNGTELPSTGARLLGVCGLALQAEPRLSEEMWDEFIQMQDQVHDASDEHLGTLMDEYSQKTAFWLRLLDVVKTEQERRARVKVA